MKMNDPRVIAVLAHAKACQEAKERGEDLPELPSKLRNLCGINLSGANLAEVGLVGANLTEADLIHANLTGADLTHANFTGANLTRADLTGANLTEARLGNAILIDAKLNGACLDYVDFTGTVLIGTNIIFLTSKEDEEQRPRLLAQFNKDGKLQIKQVKLTR